MNIDNIYNSLFQNQSGSQSLVDLSELTEKYPYCQALHFARLKVLKDANNVEYNDYLKITAAYASDREYLFTLLHKNDFADSEMAPVAELVSSGSSVESIEEAIHHEPVFETPQVEKTSVADDESRLQEIIDQRLRELNIVRSAPSPEFKLDELLLQFTEEKTETTEEIDAETNHFQNKFVENEIEELDAIGDSVEETTSEFQQGVNEKELEEDEIEDKKVEIKEPTIEFQHTILEQESTEDDMEESVEQPKNDFQPIIDEPQLTSAKVEEPDAPPVPDEISAEERAYSHEVFEKRIERKDPIEQLIVEHAIQEQFSVENKVNAQVASPVSATDTHSFNEWLKVVRKPVSPKQGERNAVEPKPLTEIIEKFIKEEPRITPSRSSFYSPGNMAKQSIIDNEDLVSETLARVYAGQGNIEKAISAYQKLSLLHPEKSAYFAALILELKQKQNT